MKKLLTLLLALVAVISVIGAGCQLAGSSGTTVTAEEAQKAKTLIEQKYRGESETTASDYKLDAQVGVDGTIVKVEWSADTDKVSIGTEMDDYGQITVKVTKTAEEVPYVLTAKIYDSDNNCLTTTFNRKIPAYDLRNWEQYLASADGDVFSIEGIVTSIWGKSLGNTYNGMYVQDLENKGGYYIYGLTSDASADGVKAGMKVSVTGTYVKNYVELKEATCTVLDSNITAVEPTDYTEIYKNATSLKDTALLEKQTLLVTLKGVELQPQTEEDISKGYYRFKLGNLTSYVRISSSVCPMTEEEQAQFKADFAANVGNKADIVGIASAYNGAFYIVPAAAGAYSNYQVVTKTAAEKVAIELEGAVLSKTTFTEAETLTLPTVKIYTDAVTFEWTSDSTNAVVEDGELKITIPDSTTTVTLTLKATCEGVADTKTFTLTLQNMTLNHAGTEADPFDCADTLKILNSLATGKTYTDADGNPIMVYIKGYVVVEGTAGSYQSKFYLGATKDTAQADAVYVYRANYSDAVKSIKLGDLVVVSGFLMDYKGTKEVGQAKVDGTTVFPTFVSTDADQGGSETPDQPDQPETTHAGTEEDPFDCADAMAIMNVLTSGNYYVDEAGAAKVVYVKGYVVNAGSYNANYKNQQKFYIADSKDAAQADGILVYRADFTTDVWGIAVGDLVVVKGYLMDYDGTKEISNSGSNNPSLVETDADHGVMNQFVLDKLTVETTLNADYTLPTSTLVEIVWSVKEESAALTIENGVAKITKGTEDVTVVLVAKISEETKEFTVTVAKEVAAPVEGQTVAFTLGNDGSASHNDGSEASSYTETVNGVTLNLTNCTKLYKGARDAKGNGGLKLGTGSIAGGFTINGIPTGVKKVVIYVAAYKARTATVTVNGTATALTKKSNDGEYDVIEVTLAEGTNEVTLEVSSGYRAMVNTIEFVY